jgi:AcrR family transcriptional regulator
MPKDTKDANQAKRILDAALKCIASKGYANVSLRDIANEAGVVLSQLNYYYKNKEGLLTAVIKALAQKYLSEVEKELKKGNLAKEKLQNIINYFKKILSEQPWLFRLLYDITGMALWSATFRELLQSMYTNLSDLIEKYIINGYDSDKSKKYSSKALAKMILGTFMGTATQIAINPKEDSFDSLNAIQTIFD